MDTPLKLARKGALLLPCCLLLLALGAQTRKIVGPVELKTCDKQNVSIRAFGKKPVLLFYVDPDAHAQNKPFRDSLKTEYRDTTNLACCVVINMKDASPFIPNALIRKVAEKEVEGVPVQLCYDFDRSLRKAWELGEGVNNTCTVMLVNARGEVLFSRLGALTSREKRALRDLLDAIVRLHQPG